MFIIASFLPSLYGKININQTEIDNSIINKNGPNVCYWEIIEDVGYWDFDEGEGVSVEDKSDYVNNGRCYGTEWITGIEGNALLFQKEFNSYVRVSDHDSLNFDDLGENEGFMIDLWMKVGDAPTITYAGLVSKMASAGGYYLLFGYQKEIYFAISAGGDNVENIYSNTIIDDHDWHHIVAVWSGEALYLYVDDMENPDNVEYVGDFKLTFTPKWLDIGNDWPTDDLNPFDGSIDEVRISIINPGGICIPLTPKIEYPKDEQVVKGIFTIWGYVNESRLEVDEVEINITGSNLNVTWEKIGGHHWYYKFHWNYTINTYDFGNGNLTIYARGYNKDLDLYSDVLTLSIYIDNNNSLPYVTITKPERDSLNQGLIYIEGEYYDDCEVEQVQIKIDNGNWTNAYMQENWILPWNTTLNNIPNKGYKISARCWDNESYYSPVITTFIDVDNKLPTIKILRPAEGYHYIWWDYTKIENFISLGNTTVWGKLTVLIVVDKPNFLQSEFKDHAQIYLNQKFNTDPYRADDIKIGQFECSAWNYRSLLGENCTIITRIISLNGHELTDQITFKYFCLKLF